MIRISVTEGGVERSYYLADRTCVRVGRDPSNDVVVRDRFVSSRHGEIRLAPDGMTYEDFLTTNGSSVRRGEQAVKVDASTFHRMPVFAGDDILVGDAASPVIIRVEPVPVPASPSGAAPGTLRMPLGHLSPGAVDVTAAETMVRLPSGFDRDVLLVLHRLTTRLSAHLEMTDVLNCFTESLLDAFPKANDVSVYLLEADSQEFRPAMARGREGSTGPHPVSRTLRDGVLSEGKAVLFDERDAGYDMAESLHDSSVRSGLCAPLWDGRRAMGLVQVDCRGGLSRSVFDQGDLELLAVFAHQAAMALANARLHANLRDSVEQAIQGLVNALEAKDTYTAGHSEAVAELCETTCARLGMSPEATSTVRRAALLHDIGKIGIPYHVLNKRDALTPDEFRVLRSHPDVGARILAPFDFLSELVPIVLHHHERWDGGGYPRGLAGEAIPLGARILAVVDTWHSLVSHRPYRMGLDHATALAELERCAGTQFDPRLVAVLASIVAPALAGASAG